MKPAGDKTPLQIVGVAADSKYNHIRKPRPPTLYVPYWLDPRPGMTVAVRHAGSPAPAIASAQAELKRLAGPLPLIEIRTVEKNLQDSVRTEALLAGFAAFALLISTTGIGGLLSYLVVQHRRETGIRLALGATPARIGFQLQTAV